MNKSKSISFGDKIFARVSKNGHTVFNFVSEKIVNMSDLISQLRKALKNMHGLVMIHIRNYNQGWGEERPLMLYASRTPFADDISSSAPTHGAYRNYEMLFPWDTH